MTQGATVDIVDLTIYNYGMIWCFAILLARCAICAPSSTLNEDQYKVFDRTKQVYPPLLQTSLVHTDESSDPTMLLLVECGRRFWRIEDSSCATYIKDSSTSCTRVVTPCASSVPTVESLLSEKIRYLLSSDMFAGQFIAGYHVDEPASVLDMVIALGKLVPEICGDEWDFLVMEEANITSFDLGIDKHRKLILIEDSRNTATRRHPNREEIWKWHRFRYYTMYRSGVGNGHVAVFRDTLSGCESLQPFGKSEVWLVPSCDGYISPNDPASLQEILDSTYRKKTAGRSISKNPNKSWLTCELARKIRRDVQLLQSNNHYQDPQSRITVVSLGFLKGEPVPQFITMQLALQWVLDQTFPDEYQLEIDENLSLAGEIKLALEKSRKAIIVFTGEMPSDKTEALERRPDKFVLPTMDLDKAPPIPRRGYDSSSSSSSR